MSQPPYPYNRIFDFESFSVVNPTTQQPGVQIEGELDNIKRTLDSTLSRLSEIQRDDGYIRDSALDQSTAIPQFYDRLAILFSPSFALKAPIASPVFTGVVTIPANAVIVGFAKIDSQVFTGVPTTPTPTVLSETQQIANAAFVTVADAAIKQFVIDNYLKLAGDRMDDDSVINWSKTTPAFRAVHPFTGNVDVVTNEISKDGVELVGKSAISSDQNSPYPAYTDKRETIISQGSIELRESISQGSGPDSNNFAFRGRVTIWSGQSYHGLLGEFPIFNPLSGPHIACQDSRNTYGMQAMMMSSMGLQFPDGTNQDTRGLSALEVASEVTTAVGTAITTLIDNAPAALDTLKEIADALGNDANLSATLISSIALKADDNAVLKLTGGTVSGTLVASSGITFGDSTVQTTATLVGPVGPPGNGWVYRGEYDGGITYSPYNYVTLNGSSYVMTNYIGAAGYSPTGYPGSWQLVAQKGDQGDIGPQGPAGSDASMVGPQGPQGDQGPQGNSGADGGSFADVSNDSVPYIRYNQSWQPLSSYDQTGGGGGISDAPSDSQAYVRFNGNWELFSNYDQNSGGGGIGEAPGDGNPYIRIDNNWQLLSSYDQIGGGGSNGSDGATGPEGPQGPQGPDGNNGADGIMTDAPSDNTSYVRINQNWAQTFRELQGNGAGDPYYPYEVKITVNGTDYWMPVRQA